MFYYSDQKTVHMETIYCFKSVFFKNVNISFKLRFRTFTVARKPSNGDKHPSHSKCPQLYTNTLTISLFKQITDKISVNNDERGDRCYITHPRSLIKSAKC